MENIQALAQPFIKETNKKKPIILYFIKNFFSFFQIIKILGNRIFEN